MRQIEVGKEYVSGTANMSKFGFAPCQCNSQYNPQHQCRVTVLSVGPKYAKALMSGSSKPQRVLKDGLWPVDEAKKLYREALESRDAMWIAQGDTPLGKQRIDELVDNL
jgi:hypothetical protein